MTETLIGLLKKREVHLEQQNYFKHQVKHQGELATELVDKIEDLFAPKQWLGQEFVLVNAEKQNYPECTLSMMTEGKLPFQRWRVYDVKTKYINNTFKAESLSIRHIDKKEKSFVIYWNLTCQMKLKSGEWGKQAFPFVFIDIVEIPD